MPVKDVVNKIHEETGLSFEEINEQIQTKLQKFDGLISEEGSAYIVASECGIKLFPEVEQGEEIKIEKILAGMQSVNFVGSATRIFEPRTFVKDGQEGKVGSFIVGDETGTIRIVLWDDRIDWLVNGKISQGTNVKVKNAYAKQDIRGGREVHLGKKSILIVDPKGVTVKAPAQTGEMKKIANLEEGDFVTLLATVVQVFPPNFYLSCPQCGKKVFEGELGMVCPKHNQVQPKKVMILNFVLDDGTETVRATAFRNTAEKATSLNTDEAQEIIDKDDETSLKEIIDFQLLGRTIEVTGRVTLNKAFERIEFQINNLILEPNPILIANQLLKGES